MQLKCAKTAEKGTQKIFRNKSNIRNFVKGVMKKCYSKNLYAKNILKKLEIRKHAIMLRTVHTLTHMHCW
jgi:hypothetical protein